MGKYFFRLLNKRFPPGHKLYKMFNKNTLKLSYSCMPNLKTKIDGHNKKILKTTPPTKTKLCNCLKKETCPMRGACLSENILFYARTNCDDETYKPKLYKGICETTYANVTQIIKNLSMLKRTRTILNYLLNTGNWQIINFTHGYPGA